MCGFPNKEIFYFYDKGDDTLGNTIRKLSM